MKIEEERESSVEFDYALSIFKFKNFFFLSYPNPPTRDPFLFYVFILLKKYTLLLLSHLTKIVIF